MTEGASLTEDPDTYFKRGARIKPALRARITAAAVAAEPVKPPADAYALAMANLHKPWARRYLRSIGRSRVW